MLRATPGVRLMKAGAFEGEHHLMHAGWRDLEVPLHVGFRGRVAEDTAVGVDEG
jgi:hypothetical protein